VKRAGLDLCFGRIIGMGETMADRIDFLCALQELEPTEGPINFLNRGRHAVRRLPVAA